MASEPKTIILEPGAELDPLLDKAIEEPLRLVRNGVGFLLERENDDVWAGYDPKRARAAILAAAGSWKDVDAEALKTYLRQRRRTRNRPPVRL